MDREYERYVEEKIEESREEITEKIDNAFRAVGHVWEATSTLFLYSAIIQLIYLPGFVIAALTSYDQYRSIGWAILHGYLSWFYIFYNLLS